MAAQAGNMDDYIEAQNLAAAKLKAVYRFLERRLGTNCFWECGSDLEDTIDLYLPDHDSEDGNCSDVFIPLTDLQLCNGVLDPASQAVTEAVLAKRLL